MKGGNTAKNSISRNLTFMRFEPDFIILYFKEDEKNEKKNRKYLETF